MSSPVPGESPTQRPVTRSFDVFFDLPLNKRLSKQSRGWLFETLSRPLWRHCNVCELSNSISLIYRQVVNTLMPVQNWRHSADDIFKRISSNKSVETQISLQCATKCLINNKSSLILVMAWRRTGDKPLPEPMMMPFTRLQCVNPSYRFLTTL